MSVQTLWRCRCEFPDGCRCKRPVACRCEFPDGCPCKRVVRRYALNRTRGTGLIAQSGEGGSAASMTTRRANRPASSPSGAPSTIIRAQEASVPRATHRRLPRHPARAMPRARPGSPHSSRGGSSPSHLPSARALTSAWVANSLVSAWDTQRESRCQQPLHHQAHGRVIDRTGGRAPPRRTRAMPPIAGPLRPGNRARCRR